MMSQWTLVCSTVVVLMGSMSQARFLGPNPNLSAINGRLQQQQQMPDKAELELESLKEQNHKVAPQIGEKAAAATGAPSTQIPQIIQKAALNMEHPTQSDNDNENSGKLPPPKSPEMFALEEKRKELGGSVGGGGLNAEADYTPKDIAEYIFWTGDQGGVALAINDFLQERLVSKEDVIRFLEDVKQELNQLKNRYSTLTQINPIQQQGIPSFPLSMATKNRLYFPQNILNDVPAKKDVAAGDYMLDFDNYNGLNLGGGRNNYGSSLSPASSASSMSQFVPLLSNKIDKTQSSASTEEDDYEELIDKLRQVDAKYREYSLEEIIYQLAKELFSQELQEQPQHSVQRFAHFLENEAALGHIPKDLGKAVLDTLVGALVDAVNEQGNLKLDNSQQQQLSKPKPTEQPTPQKQQKQQQHTLQTSSASASSTNNNNNIKTGK